MLPIGVSVITIVLVLIPLIVADPFALINLIGPLVNVPRTVSSIPNDVFKGLPSVNCIVNSSCVFDILLANTI